MLLVMFTLTEKVFMENEQLEEDKKLLMKYKTAWKKQKNKQKDSEQMTAKDEEIYNLQAERASLMDQIEDLKRQLKTRSDSEQLLLLENEECKKEISELERDLKLATINQTLDRNSMSYQIQEKVQKAEDEKTEYRQKLDEMHEKILKS